MPRELEQKPTKEYLRELYTHNEKYWAPQVRIDQRVNDLIEQEHVVKVPNTDDARRKNRHKPEKMTTGIAAHAVRVVSSVYAAPAEIKVIPTGERADSKGIDDRVEKAVAAAHSALALSSDMVRRRSTKRLVALGRRVELCLAGDAAWGESVPRFQQGAGNERETNVTFMERRLAWNAVSPLPIFLQDLPPESTFPPSFGHIDDEMLSVKDTTWAELLDQFTAAELGELLPEVGKRHEPVTSVIHCNREYVTWGIIARDKSRKFAGMFGGEFADHIIRSYKHKMGRCPMRLISAMTGFNQRPGEFWQSVLYNVLDMIPQNDARWSELATASKFSAFPWFKWLRSRDSEQDATKAAAMMKELMELDILPLNAGGEGQNAEDFGPIHFPNFAQLTQLLADGQFELIRREAGALDAIEGQPGSTGTAWEVAFRHAEAQSSLSELTLGVIESDRDRFEQIMRATVAWDEDIILQQHGEEGGSLVLKPSEVKGRIPVLSGTYELQLPQNVQARISQGVDILERVVNNPAMAIDPNRIKEEMLGIRQPAEEAVEAMKTRLMTGDRMMKFQEDLLMQEMDIGIADQEGMSVEEFMELHGPGSADPASPALMQAVQQFIQQPGANGAAPGGPGQGAGGQAAGPIAGAGNELQAVLQASVPAGSRKPGGPQPDLEAPQ